MRVVRVEKKIELLISLLAQRLERLSAIQYQMICAVVIIIGVAGIYCSLWECGLGERLVGVFLTDSSESLLSLQETRNTYKKRLLELEARFNTGRKEQIHAEQSSNGQQQDLVQALDHAARHSAVHLRGIRAEEIESSLQQGTRHRHRVEVVGDFRALSSFVSDISEQHSPIVVKEVEIRSSEWSYPVEPLAAQLVLESGTAAGD
jgi:hypothetical protein